MAEQETKTIIVNAPVEVVFDLWANFENFPHFMENIEAVTKTGDRMSHWVMKGPLGVKLEWDAETTRLEPHTRIAWNSRNTGDITNSGQVTFTPLADGNTSITVTMQWVPPGGLVGVAAGKLFDNPDEKLEQDLRRFKAFAEAASGTRTHEQAR
jgi:uncharacterized membrane protein